MIQYPTLTPAVRALLAYSPLQYMLDTVSAHPALAELHTDRTEAPTCCALRLGHSLWLAGTVQENLDDVLAILRQAGPDVLIVYCDSTVTSALLTARCAGAVHDSTRSLFLWKPTAQAALASSRVVPIDRGLLRSGMENLAMITEEVEDTGTYADMDVFCDTGIGYAFVAGNRVCGFCTSEYPSRASVAIGIEVDAPYQRQGIATEMARAFLHEAGRRGLHVYWDCWAQNEPSVRTAAACGFTKVTDYPALLLDMRACRA